MNPIVQLIIGLAPDIIKSIKDAHQQQNPDQPELTSEQVIAALEELVTDTLAKDELLRVALEAELRQEKS